MFVLLYVIVFVQAICQDALKLGLSTLFTTFCFEHLLKLHKQVYRYLIYHAFHAFKVYFKGSEIQHELS